MVYLQLLLYIVSDEMPVQSKSHCLGTMHVYYVTIRWIYTNISEEVRLAVYDIDIVSQYFNEIEFHFCEILHRSS